MKMSSIEVSYFETYDNPFEKWDIVLVGNRHYLIVGVKGDTATLIPYKKPKNKIIKALYSAYLRVRYLW